jgi:ABC-type multidrug transport system fused ATPase/permease subunit
VDHALTPAWLLSASSAVYREALLMTASPISNPSASVPYIKIDAVSKSYDGGRNVAVSNVSLDVHQGSLVALVGGSGSGKTTLLKTINRLVDPDVGEVRIDGVPVSCGGALAMSFRVSVCFRTCALPTTLP